MYPLIDCGANIVCATKSHTRIDCSAHRLNTCINDAWKSVMVENADLRRLHDDSHTLVSYVKQSTGIQVTL